ncbi:glycoside hydrolase family 78 protein [Bacteroides sp.]|uniref:glycoside hydrolase family 78 protein n=1 Tax=Bacteroides sp. TaxID=29523 RepID=UPI002603D3CF|nr:glycoside hydrolase family 78 protein [Bacteroides sp.]MDD3038565.1 glycoside hydrolase family 78 protein [Bacteroides sp.]
MKGIYLSGKFIVLFNVFLIFCTYTRSVNSNIGVVNLRCELIDNPKGLDVVSPRFSWELKSDMKSIVQKSFRILVASSLNKLNANEGDLWDSKQVNSGESIFIPYNGKPLKSGMECYWKVYVVTNKGKTEWSSPAKWTMGILTPEEWKAQWIGLDKSFVWENQKAECTRMSARYFRKEFNIQQRPVKAILYLCGLGLYKLHINGDIVGQQELSPTPTDYRKEVKYNTFDITEILQKGTNAIGVVLGNGRFFHMRRTDSFEYPKLILQMEVEFADGSKQLLISDKSWKVTANGPIIANNEYDGEEYDARKEMPEWDRTNFDDALWLNVESVNPPKGKLGAQLNQNIKIVETVHPVSIQSIKNGNYILDMGQNIVGWLKMKVKGNRGTQVVLRFAEFLNEDGTVNQDNLRGALATDKYILKGSEEIEEWEPSFISHGFRFVEISGFPGIPKSSDFEGKVVCDEMEQTGFFETSNTLINQIYKNAYWSIRGNYRGMPTDCPQRSERMGWTGDRAIGSFGESFIFNNNNLYAKWVNDICITQREDGSVSDIAPSYWSAYTDNMTWPGTYLTVSEMLYEQFGNKEPIVKYYSSMKKWLYYMRDKYMTEDNLMPRDQYGDWCTPPENPTYNDPKDSTLITNKTLIGTSYYYHMLKLLEKFAHILNRPDDAIEFERQSIQVKDAYNKKFFNKDKGYYSNNTVTANLLSLKFGLVPESHEKVVFENVEKRILNDFKGHVSTGIIGNQWLMRGLSENGRPDIAYQMLLKTDYPSFGYMIKKGATTIWEHWNGDAMEKWIDSQNHVMQLGDLIIWFYENLAGIKDSPESCGFKKIIMKPEIIDGLDEVKGSFHSVHGLIESSWNKGNSSFHWNISIPCNTTAIVYIPTSPDAIVNEKNEKKIPSKNIKYLWKENQYTVFEVGSGHYFFSVENVTK